LGFISDSRDGLTLSLTIDDLRCIPGCDVGAGEARSAGVEVPVLCDDFLTFFLEDSLPLDSERFGEPGRLSLLTFLKGSECLGRPEGVFVPFEEAPEGSFDSLFAASAFSLALASSSFLLSISACFSSSDVSSSLYIKPLT
jgi:hypothetical protein